MRCPRCNEQLADNASFCGVCGTRLSASQGQRAEAGPPLRAPGGVDGTLLAAPWSDGQPGQGAGAPPAGWSGGPPGAMQAPQPGSWPQQAPQVGWTPEMANQPSSGGAPGMQPGQLNRSGVEYYRPSVRRKSRAGRAWGCAFLVLLLLLAGLAGAWFIGVRPYLHNLVQQQLDQALNPRESQLLLSMGLVPPGTPLPASLRSIQTSESTINTDLSSHDTDQVQNLHMAITPTGMTLTFTAYGQNCSISALPTVTNGLLQVTNVQVQGVLALIMSSDELTSYLNNNLQTFNAQLTHKITKITLLDQEVGVQFG